MGIPNYFRTYNLTDNSIVNLQILDTSGQEEFKSLNQNYYKKADSIVLVYDITDKHSFDECNNYYTQIIKEGCKKDINVILIGNKSDMEDKRVISFEEGQNFANNNNYFFMETSCLKNKNVYEAFEKIIVCNAKKVKENNKNDKVQENKIKIEISDKNKCVII